MYDMIENINVELEHITNEYNYCLTNMKEISAQNEAYLKEFIAAYYPGNVTYKSTPRESIIRLTLNSLQKKKIALYNLREQLINNALNYSWLIVADTLKILDKFNIYYRAIRYGYRTLLVPIDFVLLTNSVIDINVLNKLVEERKYNQDKKDVTFMPMYCKKENNVTLNNYIPQLTSVLLVDDLRGIPFYIRKDNNITINEEILNIFPYEVISFIEYLVNCRVKNNSISIDEAYQEYNKEKKLQLK